MEAVECLDSGYILKVELTGFADELDAGVWEGKEPRMLLGV